MGYPHCHPHLRVKCWAHSCHAVISTSPCPGPELWQVLEIEGWHDLVYWPRRCCQWRDAVGECNVTDARGSSSAPSPLVTEEGRGQGTVNPCSWFLTDVQADSVWWNSSQTAGNSRIQVSTQVYLEPLRWESWMILSTLWYGIPR